MMYKRAQIDHFLDLNEGRARLHDAPALRVPFPNNETFRKSIVFRGSGLWNNLLVTERNIPTFDRFKNMLKEQLDH